MAFQVSPGVQINEIDLTNVVPAVSASIGGYAGTFNWGPIDEIRLISSEKELVNTFGTPTDETARSFLTAASFLQYGNALKAVRSCSASARNAVAGTAALLIKNRATYDAGITLDPAPAVNGAWAAKCPGPLGNSITVSVCPSATAFTSWTAAYKTLFPKAPGTSDAALAAGSSKDEMHIVVIDSKGFWTGTAGTVLEKFEFVSLASDAVKPDGTSNYYKNVLNDNSKYVWFLQAEPTFTKSGESLTKQQSFESANSAVNYPLAGGTDYAVTSPTSGEIVTSFGAFADAETVDVNLLFSAGDAAGASVVAVALTALVNNRKDAMAFVSPPIELTTNNATPSTSIITWSEAVTSSSYVVIDSTALKVYDKYNDTYRYITAAGHIAGLCANTDRVADAWFSPAGINRGSLFGVTKIAFNPDKAQRDELFKARINPIVSFPGQGIILFGDKTALGKPSAFDAINVRRLFITLEKAISVAAKAQLFEFNDEFTRAAFRNAVEPYLRNVQGRRGITDFKVQCDEFNNNGDVIDRNEFVADIYIKPARAIRGITLNFIATRTGVQFSEIAGV